MRPPQSVMAGEDAERCVDGRRSGGDMRPDGRRQRPASRAQPSQRSSAPGNAAPRHWQLALLPQYFGESRRGDGGAAEPRGRTGAEQPDTMRSMGLLPLAAMHLAKACSGRAIAGDGIAVAAETVILRIGDQAGPHGVEVDVEGHGAQRVTEALHQHGLEALGKESAVAAVGLVEPNGETLLEQFHEVGDIAHQCQLATPPRLALGTAGHQLRLNHLDTRLLVLGRLGVKQTVATQQLRIRRDGLLRHAHQDVEVVAEDRVGEDFDNAKPRHQPELASQDFLGRIVEEALSRHHSSHAVVGCRPNLDAPQPHNGRNLVPPRVMPKLSDLSPLKPLQRAVVRMEGEAPPEPFVSAGGRGSARAVTG